MLIDPPVIETLADDSVPLTVVVTLERPRVKLEALVPPIEIDPLEVAPVPVSSEMLPEVPEVEVLPVCKVILPELPDVAEAVLRVRS